VSRSSHVVVERIAAGVLPEGLLWLRSTEPGRNWLDALPTLLRACMGEWSLDVGDPFSYAYASLALPVTRSDGTDAVLKIQFPDRESEHEAAALTHWNGDGAIRLLAFDPARRALLLERCNPGTPLYELDSDAALDVMVALFPALWKSADDPFRSLIDEAAWWAEYLPIKWQRAGRPFARSLLDAALEALRFLPESQQEQVLLHQDLHAGNVLRAERKPWLVIDPKPLVGERAFGIAALVRGGELGHSQTLLRHRFRRLTSELELDAERARGWAVAQTVAWAFEGDRTIPGFVECAQWLLDM